MAGVAKIMMGLHENTWLGELASALAFAQILSDNILAPSIDPLHEWPQV
eukprot:COSAG02_NODE_3785_length_6234_cov_30.074817_1_plen_49_part_00